MSEGLSNIDSLSPSLAQFEMPSKPQLDKPDLAKYAKQGVNIKLRDFDLHIKYVGAERSYDTLHSASFVLGSPRVNEWLNLQLDSFMHQILPDSFFSLGPRWNLRVYGGLFANYAQKRIEFQTYEEQINPNFAVNVGVVSGLSLDFSFEYFNASLVLQNHYTVMKSFKAVDTLGIEDISTDLGLYYHFLDDKMHLGARVYLDKTGSWQDIMLDNLFISFAWDI